MFFVLLLSCLDSAQTSTPNASVKENVSQKKELIQRLSARDNQLTCASLSSSQLQKDLTEIVDTVTRPPWVAMRAAACLTEIYPKQSQEDLARWISAPDKKGLAFLIAGKLSKLPDTSAIAIAKAGLNGPHARDIHIRIQKQDDARLTPLLSSP